MSKKIELSDLEEVDRLIRADVGQALVRFRAGDFEGRVRRRIGAEPGPAKGITSLAKIAVPVAVVLALALSAAIYIFDHSRSPLPAPIDPGDFAAVLSRLPSLSRPSSELPSRPGAEAALSEAGRAFAGILAAAEGAEQGGQGAEGSSVRPAPPLAAPLTMRERMEILFRDKVIERVLLSCAHRSKEA